MITSINDSKTLTKHILRECKCKLMEQNASQINGGIAINADVSVKNIMYVQRIIFGILLHVIVEIGNIEQILWIIQ